MKDDTFNRIINSMDNAVEQIPSYFFKEKVVNAYYASKEKANKKVMDWFPWLNVNYQLSLTALILMINIFVFSHVTQRENYHNDIESLCKTFNEKP
jgi:hypothetical protein